MEKTMLTLGLICSLTANLYFRFIIDRLEQRIHEQRIKLYTQWVELNAYEISNKIKSR